MAKSTIGGHARSFRIPLDVIKWLKARMKESCRSLNGEVIYLIRQAMKQDHSE